MFILWKRVHMLPQSRFYFIALAIIMLAMFMGCGSSGGGDNGLSDLGSSAGSMLRLRWFPVEEAEGYVMYIEDQDGAVVRAEEVIPSGCEHRSRDGITAGLCQYDFPGDSLSGKLSLSATSKVGEGDRSRIVGVIRNNP